MSKLTSKQAVEAAEQFLILKQFMSVPQLYAIREGIRGEEGEYFLETIANLVKTFTTMPVTYATEKQGDQAIAYLHYFSAGRDWYVTERDMETEQLQAFGYRDFGRGGKLSYISIVELIENGVEIDFHWEPKTLAELKAS